MPRPSTPATHVEIDIERVSTDRLVSSAVTARTYTRPPIAASILEWGWTKSYRGKLSAGEPMPKLTDDLIHAAIEGYEAQKQRLEAQIAELRGLVKGHAPAVAATPEAPGPKRRKRSAATRRKMRDAQRARWAKIKGVAAPAPKPAPASPKSKRKISAAGRKAIIAAVKRRWALHRAAAAKGQSAAGKK